MVFSIILLLNISHKYFVLPGFDVINKSEFYFLMPGFVVNLFISYIIYKFHVYSI